VILIVAEHHSCNLTQRWDITMNTKILQLIIAFYSIGAESSVFASQSNLEIHEQQVVKLLRVKIKSICFLKEEKCLKRENCLRIRLRYNGD